MAWNNYPDAADIPAADLFKLNFGGLTFTAADAIAGNPFGVQYNNGQFNGFFYVSDFTYKNADYRLRIEGGTLSVVALDGAGNPTFAKLINGYVNIGNSAVTNATTYVPTVAPGVPEPATWAMMILGIGAVGGAMRHRKAKVAFA